MTITRGPAPLASAGSVEWPARPASLLRRAGQRRASAVRRPIAASAPAQASQPAASLQRASAEQPLAPERLMASGLRPWEAPRPAAAAAPRDGSIKTGHGLQRSVGRPARTAIVTFTVTADNHQNVRQARNARFARHARRSPAGHHLPCGRSQRSNRKGRAAVARRAEKNRSRAEPHRPPAAAIAASHIRWGREHIRPDPGHIGPPVGRHGWARRNINVRAAEIGHRHRALSWRPLRVRGRGRQQQSDRNGPRSSERLHFRLL